MATGYVQCVQCEDDAARARCKECDDPYCDMCFDVLHRRGKRALHTRVSLDGSGEPASELKRPSRSNAAAVAESTSPGLLRSVTGAVGGFVGKCFVRRGGGGAPRPGSESEEVLDPAEIGRWFTRRAKSIPIRLSYEERKVLRLVKAVMATNEYTSQVSTDDQASSKAWHQCVPELGAAPFPLVTEAHAHVMTTWYV